MEIKVKNNGIYNQLPIGTVIPMHIENKVYGYGKLTRKETTDVYFEVDDQMATELKECFKDMPVSFSIDGQ